jgi:putative DNA primase/helicase
MGWCFDNLSSEERCEIAERLVAESTYGRIISHDRHRNELVGLCPLHQEKNPSYSYNYGKDVFNCSSGCGGGDLIKLYSQIRGLDSKAGFSAFLDEFASYEPKSREGKVLQTKPKYAKPDSTNTINSNAEVKYIPESSWNELAQLTDLEISDFEKNRGWSREVIGNLDLRLIRIGEIQRIAIPIRDEQGRLLNIRKYAPGAAKNKVLNEKGHGHAQLWPLDACKKDSGLLWLCEGEADTICALSHGLDAITATGGAGTWRSEFNEYFRDRDVVIAYDGDLAGYNGAHKVATQICQVAKRVRILTWPEEMLVHKPPLDESHGQAQRRAKAAAYASRDGIASGYITRLPVKHGHDLTDFLVKFEKSVQDLEKLLANAEEVKPTHTQEVGPVYVHVEDGPERFYLRDPNTGRTKFCADTLAKELVKDLHLIQSREGPIYTWTGKHFRIISSLDLLAEGHKLLGEWASPTAIENAVKLARAMSLLPFGQTMNTRPELLNLPGGMLDLDTAEVEPHDPKYRSTFTFPFDVNPHNPKNCLKYKKFMWQKLCRMGPICDLQKFMASCLWPDNSFETALFLTGPSGTGKSTLLKVLIAMIGEENTTHLDLLQVRRDFDLVPMANSTLNVLFEAGEKLFSAQHFNSFVSGDRVQAEHKFGEAFQFYPRCKLAFSCNRLPRTSGYSPAILQRVLVINMDNVSRGTDKQIANYDQVLLEEGEGIMAWMLAGLYFLRKDGRFIKSKYSRHLLNNYQQDINPLERFWDECLTTDLTRSQPTDGYDQTHHRKELWLPNKKLKEVYDRWCEENGHRPSALNTLTARLSEMTHRGLIRKGSKRMTDQGRLAGVLGLGLKLRGEGES